MYIGKESMSKKRLVELDKQQKKMNLYDIGRDCGGLLRHLSEAVKNRLLYCDRKALQGICTYQGKSVLVPQEFCEDYMD